MRAPFRKMAVVANVNADASILCLKHGIAQIARSEIKLFPESGMAVRDVMLAVFAEIAAIGVDHRGGVEINAGHLLLVNRDHNDHAMFRGEFLHHAHRRTIGHALRQFVPTRILLRAEVRAVEKFLQAQDLRFLSRRLFDQLEVLVDHRLSDLGKRAIGAERIAGLNQGTAHNSRHETGPPRNETIAENCGGLTFCRTMQERCQRNTRSVTGLQTARMTGRRTNSRQIQKRPSLRSPAVLCYQIAAFL